MPTHGSARSFKSATRPSTLSSPNPRDARYRSVFVVRPRAATIRAARAASGSSSDTADRAAPSSMPWPARSSRISASPAPRSARVDARAWANRRSSTRPACVARSSVCRRSASRTPARSSRSSSSAREPSRGASAPAPREGSDGDPLRTITAERASERAGLGALQPVTDGESRLDDCDRGHDAPRAVVKLDCDTRIRRGAQRGDRSHAAHGPGARPTPPRPPPRQLRQLRRPRRPEQRPG